MLGRSAGERGHVCPRQHPPAPAKPAYQPVGGHDPDASRGLASPAQAAAVHGHDRDRPHPEPVGDHAGFPSGGAGVDPVLPCPHPAPLHAKRCAGRLGVHHPNAGRADHQMVDIGAASGHGPVMKNGPTPRQAGE